MDLIAPSVRDYLDRLVPERPAVLHEMEVLAQKLDFPIIGPACGWFCYQVARMVGARRIFELGSGFGYSTAWFARAVEENGGGEVHHSVWDEKLSRQARKFLAELGHHRTVHYHVSEAVEALRASAGGFDLIFMDIDKEGYPAALPVIQDKLRARGGLIADNLLWSGRIFDAGDHTPATEGVRELTRMVTGNPGWIASV
ncbi:MAG: O-methyltransferase, partial [Gemmatimonadales bacterium]